MTTNAGPAPRPQALSPGDGGPLDLEMIGHWHLAPGLVPLLAARVRDAVASLPPSARRNAAVRLHRAQHPGTARRRGDPYPDQVRESADGDRCGSRRRPVVGGVAERGTHRRGVARARRARRDRRAARVPGSPPWWCARSASSPTISRSSTTSTSRPRPRRATSGIAFARTASLNDDPASATSSPAWCSTRSSRRAPDHDRRHGPRHRSGRMGRLYRRRRRRGDRGPERGMGTELRRTRRAGGRPGVRRAPRGEAAHRCDRWACRGPRARRLSRPPARGRGAVPGARPRRRARGTRQPHRLRVGAWATAPAPGRPRARCADPARAPGPVGDRLAFRCGARCHRPPGVAPAARSRPAGDTTGPWPRSPEGAWDDR